MARKKIVFVIVEGPSDDEVIGTMLSRILDKNEVYVQIIHGDITTQNGVTNSNILAKIGTIVQNYAKNNHFKKSDFKEVIHIVDMDGAYIGDEHILEDKDAVNPIYSLVNIKSDDKSKIISRNIQKSGILDKLSCCKTVWSTIPYSCYYMSCNLDHVFYNKMNSSNEDKERDAIRFVKEYKDKIDEFITFITKSDFSVVNGYHESWEYIKQDLHSLERNTNFGLYFLTNAECLEVAKKLQRKRTDK